MQEGGFSKHQSHGAGFVEEVWDKKKILITSILLGSLVVGGVAARVYVFGKNSQPAPPKENVREVEGVSTALDKKNTPTPKVPLQQKIRDEVQKQVETIRDEVLALNPSEVATSSPQVQKILRDLGALEQYPKTQAKEICENICKNIQ